ncbi:hypothetical protein ACFLSJ_08390, partial [Verrucomicrobiota bacterium]
VGWRDTFHAARTNCVIEQRDPVCTVVRLSGDMVDGKGVRFGPWWARVSVWAGLPFIHVDWNVVNESDQAMAMLMDWSARLALPRLEDATVDFGPVTPGHDPNDPGAGVVGHRDVLEGNPRAIRLLKDSELSMRQETETAGRFYRNKSWEATTPHAAGFVTMRHADCGLTASMRWFAEEYPKGLVVRPDMLSLAVMPEYEEALGWWHDRPFVRMGRGEGKRQTFALWLHQGKVTAREAECFNRCLQDRPHLFDRKWFIESGALDAGPKRDSTKLTGWKRVVTPQIERTGIRTRRPGHREYWDTAWSNDYRGRAHLGLLQYVETADPEWMRYFDAACTHNRDVDVVHFCPEHPDWVGCVHLYGQDHTSCEVMGNIGTNLDSMLEHYLLTGDPDSLATTRGFAKRLLKLDPRQRSARGVGWPLSQLVRWYEQSGDRRFLRKAGECFQAALDYVEPRRGIFMQLHGCWNYHGIVDFMTGYLAFGLIRYHQLTRKPEALRLLELLALGAFTEASQDKGFFRYSPFPECNTPSQLKRAGNLMGALAGYLYLLTRRPLYGQWAKECYDAIVRSRGEAPVFMDTLQTTGWMLLAVEELGQSGKSGRRAKGRSGTTS